MNRNNSWKHSIVIVGILLLIASRIGAGYYYTRWYHYKDRPLFYNAYQPDRDGVVWSWDLYPPPLSDYQGNTVFADFSNNMLAVVHFPTGSDGGTYQTSASKDQLAIELGNKSVHISKQTDTLVEVDENGVTAVKNLSSGEAERIYNSLSKNSDRSVSNWQAIVHSQILSLLQKPTTRSSGGT